MSFTQEKAKNIKVCDGCQNHCRFGVEKTDDNTFCSPIIGSKTITFFTDKNGRTQSAVRSIAKMREGGYEPPLALEAYMLDLAREIAKLCDHYKTR